MVMAVATVMCFSACGKKEAPTLESYMNDHPEVRAEIDEKLGADEYKGVTVDFSGNDMTYNFDLANMDGMTEEYAKSDEAKKLLDEGLAGQTEAFVSTANTVLQAVRDDGAEIEKVNVIVNYNYGDTLITTASFESDPVSE